MLVENGASLDAAAGKEKITALSDAAENGHFVICSILFEAGADPFIKDIAVSFFRFSVILYTLRLNILAK